MNYKETIEELFSLRNLGIRPGLKSTTDLLARLGNPHKEYPAIHIAGTNGKGSTGAACEAILTAAGFSCGLYTSPHLVKFNERIRVSFEPISDSSVVKIADTVKKACNDTEPYPTFFEFATVMAFEYFKVKKVDIAIIETGLGGRLDSTNVIEPLVTIITNVARDHTPLLGTTIEEIAAEKAGIIKEGVPCITAVNSARAARAIRAKCKEKRAPLYNYGTDFNAAQSKKGAGYFDYFGFTRTIKGLRCNLRGAFQITNSACALAALDILAKRAFSQPVKAIRDGLKSVDWAGRIEVAEKKPYIILDSAHNSEAAKVLVEEVKKFDYEKLVIVAGIMEDKDIKGILGHLASIADTLILTRPACSRAADTRLLCAVTDKLAFNGTVLKSKSVNGACDLAVGLVTKKDAIIITGSIFTLGESKLWLAERVRNL